MAYWLFRLQGSNIDLLHSPLWHLDRFILLWALFKASSFLVSFMTVPERYVQMCITPLSEQRLAGCLVVLWGDRWGSVNPLWLLEEYSTASLWPCGLYWQAHCFIRFGAEFCQAQAFIVLHPWLFCFSYLIFCHHLHDEYEAFTPSESLWRMRGERIF